MYMRKSFGNMIVRWQFTVPSDFSFKGRVGTGQVTVNRFGDMTCFSRQFNVFDEDQQKIEIPYKSLVQTTAEFLKYLGLDHPICNRAFLDSFQ